MFLGNSKHREAFPSQFSHIPFAFEEGLNHQLSITECGQRLERQDDPSSCRLPDQPRVRLNTPELNDYLRLEIQTSELDAFAPYLWLLATPAHTNISTLHHQIVKGRRIVLTEDPQLHLLWLHNTIFVKPIPPFLLSHAFWKFYLSPETSLLDPSARQTVFAAARGFLRSYVYLIKYKIDFDIATRTETRLLPEGIEFEALVDFLQYFAELDDGLVSPRYHFGEIRFTRLKFWSTILMRRISFTFYGQYADHFSRFYAPLLFIFGVFTVVLSAMQVALATNPMPHAWNTFNLACRWFSVVTIVCVALMIGGLLLKLGKMVGDEVVYSVLKALKRRKI
ncbi:uncharacterized protein KY384_004134 [Bacidia gigantensis]|uniref:uncharacterized protein n=1 Tax=Bacidia gigantensis TaxID=2732470 RepID=UPI001D043B09|nr:uncharacterized protein KY384_004134 [Bacidia gigantensis]KAG8530777.1 hypothetical protein KY384_004134 [Bacidia gigantensis]